MVDEKRYSIGVENITQQEIDLLECLRRIDLKQELDPRSAGLIERLVEAGLVDRSNGDLTLTLNWRESSEDKRCNIASPVTRKRRKSWRIVVLPWQL